MIKDVSAVIFLKNLCRHPDPHDDLPLCKRNQTWLPDEEQIANLNIDGSLPDRREY
ncbi:MAG: hypothetical protein NPIRA01_17250 [Nitrospirales bacterium]|nr:MAG: hypothetical protein NPIRA01_17250 [Nitrospirales bacterium]